jgi:aryl-alcohol dehydrogenase-like predicted oxidoreductase
LKYKLFGKSGLRVSELCLGAMVFGDARRVGATKEDSQDIFNAFVEAGGNFIDTASNYANGESEKIIGELIASDRDRFVVATKYTLSRNPDDPNAGGNHRKNLALSLEASLRRMHTDHIDLLLVHAWDFLTPVEEVMRALDDQVRAGKVLSVGVSDTPAWIVAQANTLAALRGWTPFSGLQVEYSLVQRDAERDLIPMAHTLGLTVTPWSPLGGGVLTGKYGTGNPSEGRLSAGTDGRRLEVAAEVALIARDAGITPAQAALAWLLAQPGIVPIVGSRKPEQFKENLGCVNVVLGDRELQRLNDVNRPTLGFPHDFLAASYTRSLIYGTTLERIDLRDQPNFPIRR